MCVCLLCRKLLILSAEVVLVGLAIWLNPFATALFNLCSAVTVECCDFHLYCVGVFGMFAGCSPHVVILHTM